MEHYQAFLSLWPYVGVACLFFLGSRVSRRLDKQAQTIKELEARIKETEATANATFTEVAWMNHEKNFKNNPPL